MDVFQDFLTQIKDKKSSKYFPLVLLALLSACENTSDAHQCEIQLTQMHLGDDLVVERKFVPRKPSAIPIFLIAIRARANEKQRVKARTEHKVKEPDAELRSTFVSSCAADS